ncbi:MAG TPA: SHOCT domain-containing protein [Acidimicrobiia bacterium]|nr:SHOCT domain-containing protein [Acidimicrobiia bacterium]
MTIPSAPISLRKTAVMLGSLALVTASLTALFLGMRAVMDIGGACASGGPYVPVRPCPSGVPLVMVGGIWIGMIMAAVYASTNAGTGIPSFAGLFWPGLFMSLGWNFLDYAFDPPGGGGIVWGWLIPGAIFMAMGGIPLAWVLRSLGKPGGGDVRSLLAPPGGRVVARMVRGVRAGAAASPGGGVVEELERLDALRRSGAVDDEEYRLAKRRLLGGGG